MFSEVHSIPIYNSYWVVTDHLRAGEHPCKGLPNATRKKIQWLINNHTDLIVDLTETGEADIDYPCYIADAASALNHRVTYQRFPFQDWSTPSIEKMTDVLDALDKALVEGKNIYLHCYGGLGRTGMTVGCFLVRHGIHGNQALEKIQELRREIPDKNRISPETEGQKKMVTEWKLGQ